MFFGFVSRGWGGAGGWFRAIGIAMYLYLGDCREVHMQKKEVTTERRNSLQVILLKS